MSYKTARELRVKPEFSTVEARYAYDLEYVLVEWFGIIKKTYGRKGSVTISTSHNVKWFMVVQPDEDDDSAYCCKTWDEAVALRDSLQT